jgi:hypothetical protein
MIITIIEHPDQLPIITRHSVRHVIIDMPGWSVRPHRLYNWTPNDLQQLFQKTDTIWVNLDGLYTPPELTLLAHNLHHYEGMDHITGFRIHDIGLATWLHHQFPNHRIHLTPETSMHHYAAIEAAFRAGIHGITLSPDISYSAIRDMCQRAPKSWSLELFVQGPILIQYAHRRFLHNLLPQSPDTIIKTSVTDAELPGRLFTCLDTPFGHMMFAHFHRCLAMHADKLQAVSHMNWLIDARGEPEPYLDTALTLYTQLDSLSVDDCIAHVNRLAAIANRPQKPGFFLSNNTDMDWRNDRIQAGEPIGHIIATEKTGYTLFELHEPLPFPCDLVCLNTDKTQKPFAPTSVWTLDDAPIESSLPVFTPLKCPSVPGIQFKGQLYRKDT